MTRWNDICYLHLDLDAFFASVEQLDHPEYKGKPVIVGGKPGDRRSVVSTASYEARKFGVHSAMPTAKAVELCPHGIYVYPRMERYHQLSKQVMQIFTAFTPNIQQISIDEAFLDLCGTERLFGNPSNTAKRIKEEVKKQTGLTISVGLAPNRYIAKICSGLSKPDGFFEVLPGQEEAFMLSLPLEKVWGVGTKTRSKLNTLGLYTTKAIHDCSLQLLTQMFGNSTGAFLYNAVRGKEVENFSSTKSHSISNETTFSYDLTDDYIIGTALLELCESVMFRLLDEQGSCHTIGIKIRYEDFTTVTIQETTSSPVTSSTYLFERIMLLFNKKYEKGRGIRLLGVDLQNINSDSQQQDLFDFGEKKKRQLEEAILAMQKKNPAVKIQKARLLKPLDKTKDHIVFFFLFLSILLARPFTTCAESMHTTTADGAGTLIVNTEELPPETETRPTIFAYDVLDKQVEFILDGYWQSTFTSTVEATYGYGTPFALSLHTPVFSQQVDLSMWVLVEKKWYFEASFADGFEKNTVAAGYLGDGYLKEARIANRGIRFPTTYSIDTINRGIGGGDNQAPGIALHFADAYNETKWQGDFAFRYDMLESHDKTYYGYNSVSDTDISPASYMTGHIYVLPTSDITADVRAIYVESSSGSYRDLQGRTYKKLNDEQWLLLPGRCQILLTTDSGAVKKNDIVPAVAVEFTNAATLITLNTALGKYGTISSPGSGFLGAIQAYFGKKDSSDDTVYKPQVSLYSYGGLSGTEGAKGTHSVSDKTGDKIDGFFTYINGTKMLLVQHPAGFSPFAAGFRYDGGTTSADDVYVASSATNKESEIYSAEIADALSFVSTDFFSDTHTYIDVFRSDITTTVPNAAVDPEVRYPFADTYPGYYLGYNSNTDMVVRLRAYSPVSRFDIGTDATEGTIRVYKNGVLDGGANYDKESGTVTLSSSVSSSDRIYITWYQDSSTSDSGAITAAAGFIYHFSPVLATDISFSTRWAYAQDKKYADADTTQQGYFTLASATTYQTEDAMVSNTVAGTIENNNTTGYYRILGMSDEVPNTVYLTKNAGATLPQDFIPTLNSRPNDPSSTITPSLSSTYNGCVTAADGSSETEINGYAIPISWNFSAWKGETTTDTTRPWAATAINLRNSGSELASGTKFSLALKSTNITNGDYDVYLQLGVSAKDDFTVEDTGSIPTWHIYSTNESSDPCTDVIQKFNPAISSWQIISVTLQDSDRSRCTTYHDARLVIVQKSGSTIQNTNSTGTIYAGPYEIAKQGVFTSQSSDFIVTTEQVYDAIGTSDIHRFNTAKNYAQLVSWKNTKLIASNASPSTSADYLITLYRYFSEVDITPYSNINIYFRYTVPNSTVTLSSVTSEPAFTLVLDRDATGIQENGKTAVSLTISQDDFNRCVSATSGWHKLTIDRFDNTVSIDGMQCTASTISTNVSIIPVRLKMQINTAINGTVYTTGEFCFDELFLSKSNPHYILQDYVTTSYKKDGVILSANDFPVLQDFSFSATGLTSKTIQAVTNENSGTNFSGDTNAGITVATIALAGNIGHTADSKSNISHAGHSVMTTTPIASVVSGSEIYRYDYEADTLAKINSAGLDLKPLHIPCTITGDTNSTINAWAITQKSKVESIISIGDSNLGYTLHSKGSVYQKLRPSLQSVDRIHATSYDQGWADSTAIAFSTGKENASKRSVAGEVTNTFFIPFAHLSPSIECMADGTYTNGTDTLFSDTCSIKYGIPFSVGKLRITVSWKKESSSVQTHSIGGIYQDDIYDTAQSIAQRDWFVSTMPIHDMFDTQLSQTILSNTSMTATSADSLSYTSTYKAEAKRPIFGTAADFFIPSGVSLAAARDIRTSAKINDIYQYTGSLLFTAFNVFGTSGSLPIATWFEQDEYTTSFSVTTKVPRTKPEEYSIVYTGYTQTIFYVTDTNTLRTGLELSWENTHDWSTKGTLQWKRRSYISPITGIIVLFKPQYDDSGVILTRTDSFNCSFSQQDASTTTTEKIIKRQSYSINHQLNAKMNKYLTISSSLAESFISMWKYYNYLSLSATIGVKLEF
ncbi:MAG: DNA polymerase IV [Treponema sp.]|nr:DNA polymerase IV [Treponema sp.]